MWWGASVSDEEESSGVEEEVEVSIVGEKEDGAGDMEWRSIVAADGDWKRGISSCITICGSVETVDEFWLYLDGLRVFDTEEKSTSDWNGKDDSSNTTWLLI